MQGEASARVMEGKAPRWPCALSALALRSLLCVAAKGKSGALPPPMLCRRRGDDRQTNRNVLHAALRNSARSYHPPASGLFNQCCNVTAPAQPGSAELFGPQAARSSIARRREARLFKIGDILPQGSKWLAQSLYQIFVQGVEEVAKLLVGSCLRGPNMPAYFLVTSCPHVTRAAGNGQIITCVVGPLSESI